MTVIRSPISPVIFSPLRAPTALYKGGGAGDVPAAAIEWEGDEAGNYWTLEGDESGYLLLEGDEA